jgi:hypothetical protein
LRFNGDRAAFVNADFSDFLSLLSENVVWLNDAVVVCNPSLKYSLYGALKTRFPNMLKWIFHFTFDDEDTFEVCRL